ncbi:BAR domain-containing protein [Actinopolyspora lacussalsi]|uniref:type VII secretion target n=1 Tax=Actinopolyspora righensis TaxID=995060 RepID=UPI000B89D006|nr:type VII secretion target [Actinopolyspora righensis]
MSGNESINAALDAMRSDAAVWNTAAADIKGPLNSISNLKLTGAEISFFATERGLDATYDSARAALEDMLGKAAEYFQNISDNLESAAQQYERDDTDAAGKIEQAGQGLN